jgi:hypothetical protein
LRPESSQERLPTSIAEVLRLRAIKPTVCDRSAKRFAQDDGFVAGLEMQVVRISIEKALRMTALSGGWKCSWFAVLPCSSGMTFSAIVGLVTEGIFESADGN